MKQMKINELVTGQALAACEFVVKIASIEQTRTKPPRNYLRMTLTDGTDDISCTMWTWPCATLSAPPESKTVVTVTGLVEEYMGNKQIKATGVAISSNQDYTRFEPAGKLDGDTITSQINQLIATIDNAVLRSIVTAVYNRYGSRIISAPSGVSMHHAYKYGNGEHIVEVTNIARSIATNMQGIDIDLVTAGALLHDIGKAEVYAIDGPVIDYTFTAHLFEHIYTGCKMLCQAASCIPRITATLELLEHIILSHHGKLEYGSPVTPCFLEAVIVSTADGMSANYNSVNAAYDKMKANDEFTARVYPVNNTSFLNRHTINNILTYNEDEANGESM